MSSILFIFLIAASVQIVYFFAIFLRILFPIKKVIANTSPPFVSIVICAKNEAFNLSKNLPTIIQQEYHHPSGEKNFEVIIVDDFSSDETNAIAQALAHTFSHVHVIQPVQKFAHLKGKKGALVTAQTIAKGNLLLLTDADCIPASEHWIREMVAAFENDKIVAGFGAYHYQKGILNACIRFETLHTFVQYAAFARAQIPYMFVGRNVLYETKTLQSAAKSEIWSKLAYGDDDLLLHGKAAIKVNIVATSLSKTISQAPTTWKEWIAQKQRHVSTGKYYKLSIKVLLALYVFSHHLTWILGIYLMITNAAWSLFLLARCFLYWSLWKIMANRLQEKISFLEIIFLDACWIFYHLLLSPYIFIKNKITWRMP